MRYLFDEKPSLEELSHHGIKGMKWGSRRAKPTGVSAPQRPREVPKEASASEQVLARAVQGGYNRTVAPHMARYIRNIPRHTVSNDPRANEVLQRVLGQGLNRVEEQAGRKYMEGLPPHH